MIRSAPMSLLLGALFTLWSVADAPAQALQLLPLTQRVNSRVRFVVTGTDSSWHYGMLNRFRSEPPCFVVMIFKPGLRLDQELPLNELRRLQLSTYFDGSRGLARWEDTTTQAGETWWEVPADTLRAAIATCPTQATPRPSGV